MKIFEDMDIQNEEDFIENKFYFKNNIFYTNYFSIDIREIASIFKQENYTEIIYKGGAFYQHKFSNQEFSFLQDLLFNKEEEI